MEIRGALSRVHRRYGETKEIGGWANQVFTFSLAGDDDEEGEEGEEGEEKMPTCGDYIMHFLTLFWKVLFSIIPPAGRLSKFH